MVIQGVGESLSWNSVTPWAPKDNCISKPGDNGFFLRHPLTDGPRCPPGWALAPPRLPSPSVSFLHCISLTFLKSSSQNLEMRSQALSPRPLPPLCLLLNTSRELTLKIHSVPAPSPSVWHLKAVPFSCHYTWACINSLSTGNLAASAQPPSAPTVQALLPLNP